MQGYQVAFNSHGTHRRP